MAYKKHITGLKGFACVMIMIGHFLGVFVYAENLPFEISWFSVVRESRVGFLLDESYWLYLFFVVSGYLLAFSKVSDLKQLMARCVQRFLRLGLPILFAYVLIYILYICVGFHNGETLSLFENSWYQDAYGGEYTFINVVLSPVKVLILGGCELNSPYWVLRDMFVVSLIIYSVNFVVDRFQNKTIIKSLFVLSALVISAAISKIALFCFFGTLLAWLEKNINELLKKQIFYFIVILGSLGLYVFGQLFESLIFFSALIVFIPKIEFLNNIFSSKVFSFLGEISFGVYSFHWPLYCSVGALTMMSFANGLTPIAIIIAMLITTIITVVVSWLYNRSFEKMSGKLTGKIFAFLIKSK